MSDKKFDNYRDRSHLVLLYPDCPDHVKALQLIERSYDYAYVLHDRDKLDNGDAKKPHWHIILRFSNAVWASKVSKDLGIQENYIEKPRSFTNALMYLIHYNDADKAQYNTDEVKGPLKKRLIQEIAKVDKTESEKIQELFDYIMCADDTISMTELNHYALSNGYWSEYRRSYSLFKDMVYEHNMRFRKNDDDSCGI